MIAYLFPGQGSQWVGMGRDLASEFIEFRRTLEEASDTLNYNMAQLCFSDPDKQLSQTEFTQPAILAVSTAVARVLSARAGANFGLVAGHSLGEYSALVAAGGLDFSAALKAVQFRGQAMQRAVPLGMGAMSAYLGNHADRVVEICKMECARGTENLPNKNEVVEVVNFNSHSQLVLSGHKNAVEKVGKIISAEKLGRVIALPVSAPFHSSLMRPAAREMHEYLKKVTLRPLAGKIVANIDAKIYTGLQYVSDFLVRQIASPVLWSQSVTLVKGECSPNVWIEVGPGNVLQGLVKKTLESCETLGTGDTAGVSSAVSRILAQ